MSVIPLMPAYLSNREILYQTLNIFFPNRKMRGNESNQLSFDHRSQESLMPVSDWEGDPLGIPRWLCYVKVSSI